MNSLGDIRGYTATLPARASSEVHIWLASVPMAWASASLGTASSRATVRPTLLAAAMNPVWASSKFWVLPRIIITWLKPWRLMYCASSVPWAL